jgi:hypothetical protein
MGALSHSTSALFFGNEHLLEIKCLSFHPFRLQCIFKVAIVLRGHLQPSGNIPVAIGWQPLSLISKSSVLEKAACQSTNDICEKNSMTTVEDVTGPQLKSGKQNSNTIIRIILITGIDKISYAESPAAKSKRWPKDRGISHMSLAVGNQCSAIVMGWSSLALNHRLQFYFPSTVLSNVCLANSAQEAVTNR